MKKMFLQGNFDWGEGGYGLWHGAGGVCKCWGVLQKGVLHIFEKGAANVDFLAPGGTAKKKPMPPPPT